MTIIHTNTLGSVVTTAELAASSRLAKQEKFITSASFGGGGGRIRHSDGTVEGVRFAPAKKQINVIHGAPQGVRAVGIRPDACVDALLDFEGGTRFLPKPATRAWAKRHERRAARRALRAQLRAELA